MKTLSAVLLALELAVIPASAQVQIDKRRPASKAGAVSIENSFGSIKVIGWDKEEVAVTGTLAAGAEGIDLSGDSEEVSVQVGVPNAWLYGSGDDSEYRSALEIHVPKKSSISIEAINATTSVEAVEGEIQIESTNGGISVSGAVRSIDINTVTGAVLVSAAGSEMRVESVAGDVTVRGAAKEVEISTVSGAIQVSGKDFQRADLKTTSGEVRFEGTLAREGGVEIETFSGNAQIQLQPEARARFHLVTFSGQITNDIGGKPTRNERNNPYQELRFSTGLDDFDISAKTYSGNITLKVNRGATGSAPEAKPAPASKGHSD